MNKRGFLLAEETLKILIAVISIGSLVYFLTALYFNNQDKKDLELATSSLEHLMEEINAGNSEVEIYNPKGWSVLSWPYDGEYPLSCENVGWSSCICICKNPWFKETKKFENNCNDIGICLENSEGFMISRIINIDNPPITLNIDKENKKITK